MSFKNCDDAYAHGYANIPKTDPSYAAKLDADHDGFGCDQPPANFVPRKVTEAPKALASTSIAVKQDTLPVTGPGTMYGSIALSLLAIGAICLLAVKRRRLT